MKVLACTILVALNLACSDARAPTAPKIPAVEPGAIDGTYTLVRVNGERLPITTPMISGGTIQLVRATLTLGTDGTFLEAFTHRETTKEDITTQYSSSIVGTYTRAAASSLRFTTGQETSSGTIASSTLTWHVVDELVLTFER